MRWLFLATVLLSIPLLAAYAAKGEQYRDRLVLALGALLFVTGPIALDASPITWPVWPGTARGIVFSFVDSITVALLLTRVGRATLPPFLAVCALFLIPMIGASFVADVKLASIFSIVQFVQLVFLYFVLAQELRRLSAMRALLKGIAFGLIVQALYVGYQKLTGVVQAPGTFFHQNALGMAVQLAALPLLAAIMEGERNKLVYAGIIAGGICVAGGGSRASMGFFAMAVVLTVVVSLLRRATTRKWKIIGLGVMASAMIVPLAFATLQDRFGTQEISASRDEARLSFERAAVAISVDYPFGAGPNNFVSVNNGGGYAKRANIEWGGGLLDKPVHNAYLLARAEAGWFGQVTLVLLFVWVGFTAYRTAFREPGTPAIGIAAGSAAGITTVALHSNYEFAWYVMELQRLFFVSAAVVAGCVAMAAEAKIRNRNARRLQAAINEPIPAAQAVDVVEPSRGHGVVHGN